MSFLNLYKDRHFNVIKLNDGIEYKIPSEYTVEEAERLLELRSEFEVLEKTPTPEDNSERKQKLDKFWEIVFAQTEIIFQHYNPDINVKYLKKHLTHNEALEIVDFFQKYRKLRFNSDEQSESKKKLK